MCDQSDDTMKAVRGFRWFVNTSKWSPTKAQWLLAVRCVQKEELDRINRFVFKKDAKMALIGRLLLRSCAQKCFKPSVAYNDIRFDRTDRGKPFVANPVVTQNELKFDINISHSGDYCALASVAAKDDNCKVGVDVMKIEYSGQQNNRPLHDFFRLMNRQFSQSEWHFIDSGSDNHQKLSRFIRLWTLKESYVKADGIGIAFDLKRISFECPTPALKMDAIAKDTVVRVDGVLLEEWVFEESLIDMNHCVSVAYKQSDKDSSTDEPLFSEITIEQLLSDAIPIYDDKEGYKKYWTDFENKMIKNH